MKRTAFKILTLPLVLYSQAYADLIGFPDDLISDKGQTRVEFGLSYGNATSYNCSDLLSCTRSNIDSLTISPGLRYGINQTTELYSRFNWYSSRSHNTNILSLEESKSEANRFHDLWIGINHRVLDDAKYPGVLLFAEGAAMEDEAQKGKILLIVPLNSANATAPSDEFFSKENVSYFDTEILTYRQPHRNF